MSDFKAKMHQIVCQLGLCPRPRWGSVQRSPRALSWIIGPTSKGGEGRGREVRGREEKEGERRCRRPPALPLHPLPLHSK